MDLTALTLSVLVKQINRSNSSGDGFYTVHQGLSIGLTLVQPDYNSNPPVIHLTAPILNRAQSRMTCCCWSGTRLDKFVPLNNGNSL